jgi:hypothetical protein
MASKKKSAAKKKAAEKKSAKMRNLTKKSRGLTADQLGTVRGGGFLRGNPGPW